MTPIISDFIESFKDMTPNDRLKYIRKKILKINQDEFCSDGGIGLSTLKDIERGICKISDKIATRLKHKLLIYGVSCSDDFFTDTPLNFNIYVNYEIRNKNQQLSEDINYFTDRITKLSPIKIETDCFCPIIPKDALIFFDPFPLEKYESFNNTLCLIEGFAKEKKIFFLTFSDGQIFAKFNQIETILSKEVLSLCKTHKIEAVFYGNK